MTTTVKVHVNGKYRATVKQDGRDPVEVEGNYKADRASGRSTSRIRPAGLSRSPSKLSPRVTSGRPDRSGRPRCCRGRPRCRLVGGPGGTRNPPRATVAGFFVLEATE